MRRALEELLPTLTLSIQKALARQPTLVRRCRLDAEDVVQRVFERMLASPPSNPGGHEPLLVLGAWARAVAVNHLLDVARRVGRELAPADEESEVDSTARVTPEVIVP